ncbi:hypothetical protein Dxin01_04092 [Deinococcus xinjiangensis]|uniref:Uncharacterized protein n=1 Tax=Deinococcus xinjiangensis TaxID=457454 RepID=A0ABP9VKX5_9DEIO
MGKVCILKALALVLVGNLTEASAQAATQSLSDLVTTALIKGVDGAEVTPVPATSAACLAVAGIQGEAGTLVVSPKARLLQVNGDVSEDVLKTLTLNFGGTGLKSGTQLVLLTGDLNWQNTGQHEGVLLVNFERGPFTGFFKGGPRIRELVKLGLIDNQLCIAGNP